jgi:arylsulfatase
MRSPTPQIGAALLAAVLALAGCESTERKRPAPTREVKARAASIEPDVVDSVAPEGVRAALAPDAAMPLSAAETDVLLIALCTMRRDRLGFYGHARPTSPFLDDLADAGVVFEHNIAQAPWTRPSMGALYTGRYPRALHLDPDDVDQARGLALGEEHTLLAEALAERGFRTVGVVGNPYLRAKNGFAQGFDAYDEPGAAFRESRDVPRASQLVDRALELAADVPASERLYLRINTLDTHDPIYAAPRFKRFFERLVPDARGPKRRRRLEYDAAVRTTDAHLARLVTGLRRTRPNLLVVLAADHGEGLELPDHHGRGHGNHLYRSTIETPLVFQHPALSPARVDDLSMNIDVKPTVLDLLGAPATAPVDGRSLAPVLRGEATSTGHAVVFSETFFRATHAETVLDRRWQLVRRFDGPTTRGGYRDALYGPADPGARADLAAHEVGEKDRLAAVLDAWSEARARDAGSHRAVDVAVDPATASMLEQLGYADVDE